MLGKSTESVVCFLRRTILESIHQLVAGDSSIKLLTIQISLGDTQSLFQHAGIFQNGHGVDFFQSGFFSIADAGFLVFFIKNGKRKTSERPQVHFSA